MSSKCSSSNTVSLPLYILSLAIPTTAFLLLLLFYLRSLRRGSKIALLDKENNKLRKTMNDLKEWNKYLAENLKRQSMAVEDLNAMEEAMEQLKAAGKSDELSSVLVDSHEVMVKELLGKGGNGEVHIATYGGNKVALKRITQIDKDSIARFRFECFIMKDLRHPNIVRLVGVCWDDFMMGCCLEYVDNGTLEYWLREDAKRKDAKNIYKTGYEEGAGGPKSEFLRSQSREQRTLEFKEAVFHGWKAPPRSDYKKEDIEFMERCEVLITKAYEGCLKAEEVQMERGESSFNKAGSSPSFTTPKEGSREYGKGGSREFGINNSTTTNPQLNNNTVNQGRNSGGRKVSNRSAARRGSIASIQQAFGFGQQGETNDNDDGSKGWVEVKVDADSLPNYDQESAKTFKSFVKMNGDQMAGVWEAVCYFEVDMRPDQWMQSQMHDLNELSLHESDTYSWIGERNVNGYLNHYRNVTIVPIIQNRESIYKGVGGELKGKDRYITAAVSVEHPLFPAEKSKFTRGELKECGQLFLPIYDDHCVARKTLVIRYNSCDLNFPKFITSIANTSLLKESAKAVLRSPYEQKIYVERELSGYQPKLTGGLSWSEHLFDIMADCASVLKYLHNSRYYSEQAHEYMECIIHRDLKPENMLLTKAFELKLADFGEARASEEKKTMSVVGTPLYIAPEVMRNDKYDSKVDVYSFGMCLVACIRAEKTLGQFLLESLRKDLGRATRFGIGGFMLNNKMLNKKWRPKLPRRFVRAYPGMNKLIKECWQNDPSLRPDFEAITHRMNHEIRYEVMAAEEPEINLISHEDDSLYNTRMARESLDKMKRFHLESYGSEYMPSDDEEEFESIDRQDTNEGLTTGVQSSSPHPRTPPRHPGKSDKDRSENDALSAGDSADWGTTRITRGRSASNSFGPGVEIAKLKGQLDVERGKVDVYESKLLEMGIKLDSF